MKNSFLNYYNYLFLIAIIICCPFICLYNDTNLLNKKESFTPYIREMYRPYLRQVRIIKDNFYNKNKQNIYNFLRKFSIM